MGYMLWGMANPSGKGGTHTCGCGDGGRKAVAVDPAIREANLNRLKRIEGQVRGLQRMVEGGRYCVDILVQISAVQEALRNVGRELLRSHLRNCATVAVKDSPQRAEAMYDELVELFSRYSR